MQSTIAAGASSRDFFGLAYGKTEQGYQGFSLGSATSPLVDALLLIEPTHAAEYEERTRPKPIDDESSAVSPQDAQGGEGQAGQPRTSQPASPNTQSGSHRLTRYFGSIELDPVKASLEFSKIVSELVELFSATAGTKVRIRVDIEAEDARGFSEATVRAARENGRTLRLKTADFDS